MGKRGAPGRHVTDSGLRTQDSGLTLGVLLSACSSLTSLAFLALVGRRYLVRRQPALVVWTLGLLWYAISTGSQALGELHGWDVVTYRWWYLSWAFYTAAFLGMGSIYLVAPRQVAHAFMAC